jgi:hypothetical protein
MDCFCSRFSPCRQLKGARGGGRVVVGMRAGQWNPGRKEDGPGIWGLDPRVMGGSRFISAVAVLG